MLTRNRRLACTGIAIAALGAFGGSSIARADDAPPTEKKDAAKSQPSPAEIGQWIKDLDSDTFATRQTAAEMLFQTGKAAVEPVAEASVGKSLEVTMQAINILRRLSQSADRQTHDAAKDALERLAKSESAAAAPAKEALAPPPPATNPNPRAVIRGFGGMAGGLGNIQIIQGGLIPAGGVQVFRIQAQANGGNGKRVVDVNENGKQTRIEEDQNGIEVKVTEKVAGNDKTDTFKAKDADDLKKKFPEAHKLFEKYMNGPGIGNIQIQAQAIPIQIGGLPPGFGLPPGLGPQALPNADAQKQAAKRIGEAQKRMAEAEELILNNVGAAPANDELKRAVDKLHEAQKDLKDSRDKLDH